MPNLFRTAEGIERKPGPLIPFELPDSRIVEAIWAGSATEEKLDWWLQKPGSELAQSEPVIAVASKADDDGELIWGDAPAGARLFFVIEAQATGKSYRLAKMVTTAATPAQAAYFRHDRAALFGHLRANGGIHRIAPPTPPKPLGPAQRELF